MTSRKRHRSGGQTGTRHPGQGPIERDQHLRHGKPVQARGVAVEMPLAALLLARRARQHMLDEPDIAAPLDGFGSPPNFAHALCATRATLSSMPARCSATSAGATPAGTPSHSG